MAPTRSRDVLVVIVHRMWLPPGSVVIHIVDNSGKPPERLSKFWSAAIRPLCGGA
jgi:hypothetical protein